MNSNKFLILVSLNISILIWVSCSKKENPVGYENDPIVNDTTVFVDSVVQKESFMNYQFIAEAPFYKQSSILSKQGENLYRFGTYHPVQIYNLTTASWSQLSLYDTSFARWDGAAVTVNNVTFIIAVYNFHSYDIIKFYPDSQKYEHTGANLPLGFDYPAYCQFNNDLYFLASETDSVYKFNTLTNELTKIVENPFYVQDSNIGKLLSSGGYQNYFYVLASGKGDGQNYSNDFYRLDLFNNLWEKVGIPPKIKNKRLFGSSIGERMILFCDTISTYGYLYEIRDWSVDSSSVPIFGYGLNGELMLGEWSFFPEDSCLYGSDVYSKRIWKMSLK